MKHRTADLEGALLDAAVALAEGLPGFVHTAFDGDIPRFNRCRADGIAELWSPSTNWELGGPIMDREHISVLHVGGQWEAYIGEVGPERLGEEVDLP